MNLNPAIRVGAWSYEFPQKTPEQLIKLCNTNHLHFLYLSVHPHYLNTSHPEYDVNYSAQIRHLLDLSAAQNISIHFMTLQDANFCNPSQFGNGMQLINEILAFLDQYPMQKIAGIHLDVEPHAHDNWSTSNWSQNNEIFDNWLSLINTIHVRITTYNQNTSNSLKLSAAVGYWYNERFLSGILNNGSVAILHQYLDFIVPMVYGGIGKDANDIISKVNDEINVAPTVVGIGHDEFSTTTVLEQTIRDVDAHFQNYTTYEGIAFFHSEYLVSS
jgi:hypothetical protein